LRGPWQFQIVGPSALLASGTLRVPDGWREWFSKYVRATCGAIEVKFSRRFGQPRGLEQQEQLYLVVESQFPIKRIQVNGSFVATESLTTRADIREVIQPYNEVILFCRLSTPEPCEFPEVRLEICSC
jgi:hypothetical protein